MKKSYPTIEASIKTLQILKLIGKNATPTTPDDITKALDLKYATVMTHLITLERENFIEEVTGGFIGSLELATFWAIRKGQLAKKEQQIKNEKNLLGV